MTLKLKPAVAAGAEEVEGEALASAADLEEGERGGAVEVHVGDTLEAVGQRVVDAWHRAERGEHVRERHVGFETWEGMVRALSPKRLELLRHLQRDPARNVRALSQALGRDYHRVHEDVLALERVGLLERGKDGVRAVYDALDVQVRVPL